MVFDLREHSLMKSNQLQKKSRQFEIVGHFVHLIDADLHIVDKFDDVDRNGQKEHLRNHQNECAHNSAAGLRSGQKTHPKVSVGVKRIAEIGRET